MRNLKLVGISLMLCVVLTGCPDRDDPLPPGEWSAGNLHFWPIHLTPDHHEYRISDRNGNWNHNFTSLSNFWDVFDVPTQHGATSHRSQINVTTTYSSRLFHSREYNSRFALMDFDKLRVYTFYDNNRKAFDNQTVNINIFSGLYQQRPSGRTVRLFWNWNGRAGDFRVNNITHYPGQIPLIFGGTWQEEGTSKSISLGGSTGGEVHSSNGGRLELVEHNNDRCPLTAVRQATLEPLVAVEAIQIGPNSGELKVYATRATFNAMMHR